MCSTVPEAAEATALLQCLRKHLIFADVVVTDGATGESHRLLEVVLPDLWHGIVLLHLLPETKTHKMVVSMQKMRGWSRARGAGVTHGQTEEALTMAEGLVCLSLSRRISFSMLSLMASLHARWQISVRSAPENPLVIFARKSKSTSYKQIPELETQKVFQQL